MIFSWLISQARHFELPFLDLRLIRTVKILDQLTEALNREGYSLKRSSVYLRFLPSNSITKEGKRHVTAAPVKLISAKNSKHQNHPCTNFAKAIISTLEELAGLFGRVRCHSIHKTTRPKSRLESQQHQNRLPY